MKIKVPANISTNGTNLHDGCMTASINEHDFQKTLIVCVGSSVAEVLCKANAMRLAAWLIQAAQRLP